MIGDEGQQEAQKLGHEGFKAIHCRGVGVILK